MAWIRAKRTWSDFCNKGHSLNEWGREIDRRGWGKYIKCTRCEKESKENCQRIDPEKYWLTRKRYEIKKFYGVTFEEAMDLFINQGSVCGICKEKIDPKTSDWCVDHSHKSGKVRGILCNNCNRSIGLLKDSVEVLKNAISYLENKN